MNSKILILIALVFVSIFIAGCSESRTTGVIYTSNTSKMDTTTNLQAATITLSKTVTSVNVTASNRVSTKDLVATGTVSSANVSASNTGVFPSLFSNVIYTSVVASNNDTTEILRATKYVRVDGAETGYTINGSIWMYQNSTSRIVGLCWFNGTGAVALKGACTG